MDSQRSTKSMESNHEEFAHENVEEKVVDKGEDLESMKMVSFKLVVLSCYKCHNC